MTVSSFLFRINRLREANRYSWEQVFNNFHYLVTDQASTWYWLYLMGNPRVDWSTFRMAFTDQFHSLETDSEIFQTMNDRRQSNIETFDEFYTDLMRINSRLRSPKPPSEIIELIKQNVKDIIAHLIFTVNTDNLAEMVYECRKAERFFERKDKVRNINTLPIGSRNRNINEVYYDEPFSSVEEIPIEAVNLRSNNRVRDQSKYVCWNCRKVGHGFMQCPENTRKLFCYFCGSPDTTTPNCHRCQGNVQRGEITPGDCRSLSNNPS